MVNQATCFRTKYGSIWKTETQAEEEEMKETRTAFMRDMRAALGLSHLDIYYGAAMFQNKEDVANVIIKYLEKELHES